MTKVYLSWFWITILWIFPFSISGQTVLLDEDFDGVTPPVLPEGWVAENASGTGTTWVTYAVFAHSPPNCVSVFGDWQPKDEWLFSPAVTLEEGVSYRLSFYYRTSSTPLQMQVKMGEGASSGEMTTQVFLDENIDHTVHTEGFAIITPEEELTVHFGWNVYDGGNQGNIYMDDILLVEMDPVPEISLYPQSHNFGTISINETAETTFEITNLGGAPLNITGVEIEPPFYAAFSATIAPGHSEQMQVEFLPDEPGVFQDDLVFLIDGSFEGNNTLTLHGLAYEALSGFFEDFEGSDQLPDGWTSIIESTGNSSVTIYEAGDFYNHAYSGIRAARLFNRYAGDVVILVTPELADLSYGEISFWTKVPVFPEPLIIGTLTENDDHASFYEIATITSLDEYHQHTFTFEGAPAEHTYIGFKHGASENMRPLFVDDVEWLVEAVLSPPVNLQAQNLEGGGGVFLEWETPQDADPLGYNVYRDEQLVSESVVEDTEFTDYDIEHEATYNYYVTAVYPGGESEPSNVVEITADAGYRLIYASAGENGEIIPEGTIVLGYGENQDFEITAHEGFLIKTIAVDGVPVGEAEGMQEYTYMFENVTGDHEIHAEFESTVNIKLPVVENFKIYPNPAGNFVTVALDDTYAGKENLSYRIFDLQGRILLKGELPSAENIIYLDSLRPGIFLLEILDESRKEKVFRLDKQ